jgi:hypothetical protein
MNHDDATGFQYAYGRLFIIILQKVVVFNFCTTDDGQFAIKTFNGHNDTAIS